MQYIGYDAITTLRVRYSDDSHEELAIIEEPKDNWWQGSWDSYLNNLIKACVDKGLVKNDWETMMIVTVDWEDDSCELVSFHVTQGENKFDRQTTNIWE